MKFVLIPYAGEDQIKVVISHYSVLQKQISDHICNTIAISCNIYTVKVNEFDPTNET